MAARVYQIIMNKTQRDAINKHGWDNVDVGKALSNVQHGFKGWMPHYQQYYKLAFELESDSLDEVFELTNLYPKSEKVTRVHNHAMSTSVGHIIELDGTRMFMVEDEGFERMYVFEDEIDPK